MGAVSTTAAEGCTAPQQAQRHTGYGQQEKYYRE